MTSPFFWPTHSHHSSIAQHYTLPHDPAALASLSMRYPLREQKSFRKTAVLISALAHWSSILAEVEFAPSWCYPFVVVFSQVGDIRASRGKRGGDCERRFMVVRVLYLARLRRREREREFERLQLLMQARSMFQRQCRPSTFVGGGAGATNANWNKIQR